MKFIDRIARYFGFVRVEHTIPSRAKPVVLPAEFNTPEPGLAGVLRHHGVTVEFASQPPPEPRDFDDWLNIAMDLRNHGEATIRATPEQVLELDLQQHAAAIGPSWRQLRTHTNIPPVFRRE